MTWEEMEGVEGVAPRLSARVLRACKGPRPLREEAGEDIGAPPGTVLEDAVDQTDPTKFGWRRWYCPVGALSPGEQTDEVLVGGERPLRLWLRHTSASLTVNENADGAVRRDFERFFNRLVPQGQAGYEHDYEGPDDLPAHFKASLLGCQVSLPVSEGRLALGTWQGIYLGEHRDQGGARQVLATLHGMAS